MWHTANAVKTLYDFTMSEWYKKNHLEQDATDKYTIQLLTQEKVIFNRNQESKKKIASYVVDLKILKVERSFDRELCGCYYDGIFYHFDSNKNILELIDLETGETKEKVDYSTISEGIPESIQYRSYNEEMKGLDQFPSHTFAFPNTSCSFSPLKRLKMLILCGGALLGDLT